MSSHYDTIPRICPANSTITPLGADEVFTGPWIDVQHLTTVTTAVKADVAGTLRMEFSNDPSQSTADSSLRYDIAANLNEVHSLKRTRRYYRTRYINGSSAQTSFEITTMYENGGLIAAPKNLSLGKDADALATRDTSFDQEVAEGLRQGYTILNKFGRNTDVDTGTVPEDIWNGGGLYTGFNATAAETLEVFSSDANDTAAGSGARTVQLWGLDADYNEITEVVTLNGTTPVLTVNEYLRMDRAAVLTSNGNNQTFNAGSITARQSSTTANVMMVMPAGTNSTQICGFTVPAGKTAYIKSVAVELNRANTGNAVGVLFIREFGSSPQLVRPFSVDTGANFEKYTYGGIILREKADFSIRITSASANNTDVQGYLDVLIRDND